MDLPGGLTGRERVVQDIRRGSGELVLTAGPGQGHPVQVVTEIERRVVDPARVVEPEGDGHQSAPQGCDGVHLGIERADHPLERIPPRGASGSRTHAYATSSGSSGVSE